MVTTNDGLDWSPLDYNPAQGDPDRIRTLAQSFHSFADDVQSQNDLLKPLKEDTEGNGIWEGDAAKAFIPKLKDLPDKLDKVITSYREAGDALDAFWPTLRTCQDEAKSALAKAADAVRRLGTAQADEKSQKTANQQAADAAKKNGQPAPSTTGQHDFGADASAAQADLNAALKQRDTINDTITKAASKAADAIDQASKDGIKNKPHHWWDTVVDWVKDNYAKVLKVISTVCNTLSAICGILAILTVWCPALSAFFETASLVTGAIGLAADCILALTGNGSWGDVLLDATAVALGGASHVFGAAGEASKVADTAVKEGTQALDAGKALESGGNALADSGAVTVADSIITDGTTTITRDGVTISGASYVGADVNGVSNGLTDIGRGEDMVTAGQKMQTQGLDQIYDGSKSTGDLLKDGGQSLYSGSDSVVGRAQTLVSHPITSAKDAFSAGQDAITKGGGLKNTFTTGVNDFVNAGGHEGTFNKISVGVGAYGTAMATNGDVNTIVGPGHGVVPQGPGEFPGVAQTESDIFNFAGDFSVLHPVFAGGGGEGGGDGG